MAINPAPQFFQKNTRPQAPVAFNSIYSGLGPSGTLTSNTDTLHVYIPAGVTTEYCLDTAVFDFPGPPTNAGFCSQGNFTTVTATNIDLECVELVPAAGFWGTSPDLICVIHCFENNFAQCDTTYLEVTVLTPFECESIFLQDTIEVPFTGNPTPVCIPLTPSVAATYELIFNGVILSNLHGCDYDSVVVYTYAFLVGGGFAGPYTLDTWTVNGFAYTGFFNNVYELVELMNAFDPTGNWQINTNASIIYGGDPSSQYGNILLTHVPTGSQSIQMTNFSIIPKGFLVNLTGTELHTLIALDLVNACSDTLYINPGIYQATTDTVYLTTVVNTPTSTYCLQGNELPGNQIFNIGFCGLPTNGNAPLSGDSCVFYIPELNFAGQDSFCVVICDNSFPQNCDTTVFVISVLPEVDTVFLTIPAGETTVDTCLDDFVIELPGAISSAQFCGIHPGQMEGQVNGNCLVFNAVNNFYGTSQACVVHCSGSVCDTTIVFVLIEPPVNCGDIFVQSQVAFSSPDSTGFYCIPIPSAQIVNYTVAVDGAVYSQSFVPCNLMNLVFYDYSVLSEGPYFVENWKINGHPFSGSVPDLPSLVDSMNVWDPSGGWADEPLSGSIRGGVPGNIYSDMTITPAGGATVILETQLIQVANGSQISLNGYGPHEVIVTASNGCADTIIAILEQHLPTKDTIYLYTAVNTLLKPICTNTDELLGNPVSLTFCSLPANGSISTMNDTCAAYLPNVNFAGTDIFCMVVCDDYPQQVCDTLIVIIAIQAPVDTLFIEATTTAPFDTCLTSSTLQLPGEIATAEVCDANPDEVAVAFNGNCLTIDLADDFQGTTTICVTHCTGDTPPFCDTTILVVHFEEEVLPCPEIFSTSQVFISLAGDTGQVCLPISTTAIPNYEILLDGSLYGGVVSPCDFDSAFIYYYGLVYGQGSQGPYAVSWNAYGNTFTATASDISALVDYLNDWDPAGNWQLHPSTFTISSTNTPGIYGTLTITHIETGTISSLGADFSGIPSGALIKIMGSGTHEIILTDSGTGCADTLTVTALNMVNVVNIETVENVPSQVICLDTSGLPGTFAQMAICLEPQNGLIILNGNCFTYNPSPGFTGEDQACLVVCDETGFCDTTLVNITVTPLCGLFNFFPGELQEFHVTDCYDIAAYCVPLLLDSISHFGVLDNGVAYAGDFLPCNSIYTQIQLDTGYHEIIFLHLNTGCVDTLLANVTCDYDSTSCGIHPVSSLPLTASDCEGTAPFCVNIALSDISKFHITDNGADYTGAVELCDLNTQFASIQLDTGFHQIVFEDTIKGCANTFDLEVNCLYLADTVIELSIQVGDTTFICLEDYGFPLPLIDSVVNICPGNGNGTFSLDTISWCISITGDFVGADTACFKVFAGAKATAFIYLTVLEACSDFFPDDFLWGSVLCSLDTGLVCLPVSLTDMQNKVISLDNELYSGPIVPCNFDSIFVINYSELPNQGNFGPYVIENWTVDNVGFSGTFNTAQEMVNLMNQWDPAGNWKVTTDPFSQATLITGGHPQVGYGPVKVVQILTGIEVILGINANFIPTGISILIPSGAFTLSILDTLTLCSETVTAQILCVESEVVIDTIQQGASDTLCLDFSDLPGAITNIENLCGGSGTTVSFTLENNCVIYEGNSPGTDTACFVVCDNLGICDTTYFFITVIPTASQPPIAVDDSTTTGPGIVIIIDVLNNDTFPLGTDFSLIDGPLQGQAIFLPDGTISYVPNDGYCNDAVPDVFTYQLCNALGCDTATVSVIIQCTELEVFDGFSPNGDGINDFFKINGLQNYPDHKLLVFNRWGNKVFEATHYQSNWDGTWNGEKLPDGTYFYYLDLGKGQNTRSGYVQLNR